MALIASRWCSPWSSATDEVSLATSARWWFPWTTTYWRWFTTPFVHDNLGYQFVALTARGDLRHAARAPLRVVPVVLVFFLAGAAGAGLAP